MQRTQHRPMQALWASRSWFCGPRSHVLHPSGPCNSSPCNPTSPSLVGFSKLFLMFGCGFLPLLLSAARGSFSDDVWFRHLSECSRRSLGIILITFFPVLLGSTLVLCQLASGSLPPRECQAWAPSSGLQQSFIDWPPPALSQHCPSASFRWNRLWVVGFVAGTLSQTHHWESGRVKEDSLFIASITRSRQQSHSHGSQEVSTALAFHIGLQMPPPTSVISSRSPPSVPSLPDSSCFHPHPPPDLQNLFYFPFLGRYMDFPLDLTPMGLWIVARLRFT